jgi:nitrogen regulatory protein A
MMLKSDSHIAEFMERVKQETVSDFVGVGLMDNVKRKLCWQWAAGSISQRSLQVEQKLGSGLSGAALRSGRPASISRPMPDRERFKLGEPLMLAEQLVIAAAVPIVTDSGTSGILLLGRRTETSYSPNELERIFLQASPFAL